MSAYEVPEPIIKTSFEEPKAHWHIEEGEEPGLRPGQRPAMYFYRDPKAMPERFEQSQVGIAIELKLVNRIRERVNQVLAAVHSITIPVAIQPGPLLPPRQASGMKMESEWPSQKGRRE